MIYVLIGGSILLIIGGSIFFYNYIKKKYKEYDEEMLIIEQIQEYEFKIKSAMYYFRNTYNNDFDNSIYKNISTNEEFIRKLILKLPKIDQAKYFKMFYERLYEIAYRLKTNKDDVMGVINPLKSLREELVREKINYINNILKEDTF